MKFNQHSEAEIRCQISRTEVPALATFWNQSTVASAVGLSYRPILMLSQHSNKATGV